MVIEKLHSIFLNMANVSSQPRIFESIPLQNPQQELAQVTINDEFEQPIINEESNLLSINDEIVDVTPRNFVETYIGADQMANNLRGVDSFKWIYVSKLHSSTSEEEIINFVSSKLTIP